MDFYIPLSAPFSLARKGAQDSTAHEQLTTLKVQGGFGELNLEMPDAPT